MGIIWKKSLSVSPVTNISSDRLCAVRLSVHDDPENVCSIAILCVYLPSSDHPFEEFEECVKQLSCATSALESGSPSVLLGDFNTHLSTNDKQSEVLTQVIKECNLYTVSTSCIAQGPGYTFFSGERRTMVDYIFLDAHLRCAVVKCHTHNYHNLNFSDHLPLSISLQLNAVAEVVFPPKVKINWLKSVERDLIYEYSLEVSNIVSQFLSLKDQSVAEINHEVLFVSNAIVQAASKHLTAASRYKKKAYINDEQLRKLCRESRDAWEQWKVAGCPSEGNLCEKKRNSKKLVRQYVYSCRAKL